MYPPPWGIFFHIKSSTVANIFFIDIHRCGELFICYRILQLIFFHVKSSTVANIFTKKSYKVESIFTNHILLLKQYSQIGPGGLNWLCHVASRFYDLLPKIPCKTFLEYLKQILFFFLVRHNLKLIMLLIQLLFIFEY